MCKRIASSLVSSRIFFLAIGMTAVGLLSPASSAAAADDDAETALKRFAERLAKPSGDRVQLRGDILDFRRRHPGTPVAVRASALLSRLRSPLDNLRAANIPTLERFDWQPKELVGVVGEHRGRHAAVVTCVAYSADGTMIASGGGQYVRLWDSRSLRLLALASHPQVTSLAFSRDNKSLVAGGSSGAVSVWNVSKEKQLKLRFRVQACSSAVYSVAFAPDNKSIAAGCFDNAVRLYDVSGKKIEELATLNDHAQAVSAVAYSPDGKTLASGSYDKSIRLWTLRGKGTQGRSLLQGHADVVSALAYSPRGVLASASNDGIVVLWGVPDGRKPKPRLAFSPKAGRIAALAFSTSGNTLALACADGSVRLWKATGAPRERFKLQGHAAAVNGVAYAPDNRTLLSGGNDWTVRSWDVSSSKPKERFTPWSHLSYVYSIDFSLDLTTLASGSLDRIIRLWDLTKTDLKTRAYLKSDDKVPIYTVAYSPDGQSVATGGACVNVRQWDAHRPTHTQPTLKTPEHVNQLLYSPDSRFILTRGLKNVVLWDAKTGAEIRRFDTEDMDVHCAAWSPDGKRVLTGHGIPLRENGKYVFKNGALVYTDCVLRMFDTETGEEVYKEKYFTMPIFSVGFSVDGRQAFSGVQESALRRWELTPMGLKMATGWKGSSGYAHFLRFSPDGKQMLTSGLDAQLVLWDVAEGKRLRQWTLPEQVSNAVFTSDSRHVAVALATGVIYLLRLSDPH